VLSAIGEPRALASIHQAWMLAKAGIDPHMPAVISRRRVLDLLDRDARRPNHRSMSTLDAELDAEQPQHALRLVPPDPCTQLECLQLVYLVRGALACFGATGIIQKRQAHLLQRRKLDEVSYRDLATELACSKNALRVRVHAAMKALHRHIERCHPELLSVRSLPPGSWDR
jgi:DNA-directed RNA polymerase specialized sigma24 family protein